MNRRAWHLTFPFLLLVLLIAGLSRSSFAQNNPGWTEPFPPHRIVGNLYYVGSKELASYLIVTKEGNILINSSLESSVPLIKKSIEQLGFKFSDTRVLLISHAHFDHDAGSATIKELTGAKYLVMDADVPVVEDGGKSDFFYGKQPSNWYKPAKVDRVLHDGDIVTLGDATLVARKTPGHTRGCTTWTMTINDGGHPFDVVIVGSPNVNTGYKLVNNAEYPQIATDFARTFDILKSLHCDIFLGAHGAYYGLEEKYARMKRGAPAAFFDPEGYKRYVIDREGAFKAELARQQKGQAH
ncbi:MAG: subclass B3 metallo-beta-lactamase [Acidobacteria bacterium]|nr:subclass B3 metallo-beta-lactamase [Acidobacteriota bacterium]